jgi:hypothetical protein
MTLLADCDRCMRATTRLQRQAIGCGYEPPAPKGLAVGTWRHEGDASPHEQTTCPGYTTRLPDVVYVSRARLHWSMGELGTFLGGEPPSEALLLALEILEVESRRAESWALANRPER